MMKTDRFIKITLLQVMALMLLTVALSACSSQKSLGKTANPSTQSTIASQADMRVELQTLVNRYGSWQRLRMPVTVVLQQPKQISISGTAIMDRGRSITMTLKFFGFEIGSLYVDNDSITVIDKIHKAYAKEPVADFLAGAGLNVANIQDLLLGRLFLAGSDDNAPQLSQSAEMESVSPTRWLLIPKTTSDDFSYGFNFSPVDCLSGVIMQARSNNPVSCVYSEPTATPVGPMSPTAELSFSKGRTEMQAEFQWNFDKARWNDDVDLRRPAIGQSFRKITSSEIAEMISKL